MVGKIFIKCGYERKATDSAPEYECPSCQVVYAKVEKAALGREFTPEQQQEIKSCPYCGERILAVALKCKHCGSDLGRNAGSNRKQYEQAGFGALLLGLPVAAAALSWAWIGYMSLIQNPAQPLAVLTLVTVLATSAMMAWEIRILPEERVAGAIDVVCLWLAVLACQLSHIHGSTSQKWLEGPYGGGASGCGFLCWCFRVIGKRQEARGTASSTRGYCD
ncbi:MAG: hypothetical protein Q7T36_05755 [Fluviicoccus sp.]|uniref:hypothetical protein n=1 Tax=Fluviicoccus sp. TaxID=2003552 RepID=UPI0027213C3D|nr:hypothetical protein [Fluviicoccus sp.]MDO8329959.1 hypothetical protein [Fluviicoccus sp.]